VDDCTLPPVWVGLPDRTTIVEKVVPYAHEEQAMKSAANSLRRRLRGVVSLGTFVAVVVAVGVSLLYLAWVATIRSSDQIGELSVGTFVVGLSCTFASVMLTISMIRAIRSARDGRAMLAALLAGGFAIAAGIALGASDILGKLAS
jgi:uncharacterized membrane protein